MTSPQPRPDATPTTRRWLARVLMLAAETLVILILVCAIFLAFGVLPNRWYRLLAVYSGSMAPTFYAGDLILITPPPGQLSPGMILTLQVDGELVTHRLVGYDLEKGLITKGDANPGQDDWSGATVAVRGLYRARIPYLGFLVNLRQSLFRPALTGSWLSDSDRFPVEFHVRKPHPKAKAALELSLTFTPTATPTSSPTPEPTTASPLEVELVTAPSATPTEDLDETLATPTPVPAQLSLTPTLCEPTTTAAPVEPSPTAPPAPTLDFPTEVPTEDPLPTLAAAPLEAGTTVP